MRPDVEKKHLPLQAMDMGDAENDQPSHYAVMRKASATGSLSQKSAKPHTEFYIVEKTGFASGCDMLAAVVHAVHPALHVLWCRAHTRIHEEGEQNAHI